MAAVLRPLVRHAAARRAAAFRSPAQIPDTDPKGFTEQAPDKLVLYRARWMRPLRLVVRFALLLVALGLVHLQGMCRLKVFQLAGFTALAIPLSKFVNEGTLSAEAVAASLGVTVGATGATLTLWYYSRRYIGELSLVPPYPERVQISTIDFWGNRENLQVPISKLDPPFLDATPTDLARMANNVFVPLPVVGKRQFCLALAYGQLYHKRLLFALLSGTLNAENFEELLDKTTSTTS